MNALASLESAQNLRPDNQTEKEPRYLQRSQFRTNPDVEYEQQVSDALRDIEEHERALHDGNKSWDIIWQMLLKDAPTPENRGQDSLQMEEQNPEWSYKLITGELAEELVTITFSSVPGLASLYHSYPHFVQRSDLLRYLVLWYFGGYYADMDVIPTRKIKDCPAIKESVFNGSADVSLVLGIEIDEPFATPEEMHFWHWARPYGFLQYTIYAPRRFSPLLREVIVRVISHTKRHLDESNFFIGPRYNELTTLEITGPGVFTDAVLDVLNDSLPTSHPLITRSVEADAALGKMGPWGSEAPSQRVTWAPFHHLQETLCVNGTEAKKGKEFGGLCVLPINAWANGQRHSNAEGMNSPHACVNHRFGGAWKPWKHSWKNKLFDNISS
ncbi:hypothetical protein N7451_007467 [Penicillium sp. IBT 35674x]|nr:hypothetical protein N7451_007467 [Penicillium sp. IBT 35674x]